MVDCIHAITKVPSCFSSSTSLWSHSAAHMVWLGRMRVQVESRIAPWLLLDYLLTAWPAAHNHSSPPLALQLGFGWKAGNGATILNLPPPHLRQTRCHPSPLDAVSNLHHEPWRWRPASTRIPCVFLPFAHRHCCFSRPRLTFVRFRELLFSRTPVFSRTVDGQLRNSRWPTLNRHIMDVGCLPLAVSCPPRA